MVLVWGDRRTRKKRIITVSSTGNLGSNRRVSQILPPSFPRKECLVYNSKAQITAMSLPYSKILGGFLLPTFGHLGPSITTPKSSFHLSLSHSSSEKSFIFPPPYFFWTRYSFSKTLIPELPLEILIIIQGPAGFGASFMKPSWIS